MQCTLDGEYFFVCDKYFLFSFNLILFDRCSLSRQLMRGVTLITSCDWSEEPIITGKKKWKVSVHMVIASGVVDRRPFGPLTESSSSFFSEDLVPAEVNNESSFSFLLSCKICGGAWFPFLLLQRQVGFWKSESIVDEKGVNHIWFENSRWIFHDSYFLHDGYC
jgi:hypothetical protein